MSGAVFVCPGLPDGDKEHIMARYNLTTAIPYVNGRPHIGHALELVQADVLARHRRQRGDEVRFQSGTDDNALRTSARPRPKGSPRRNT